MAGIALLIGAGFGIVIGYIWSNIKLGKLLSIKKLLERGEHALLVAHFENPNLESATMSLITGELEREEQKEASKKKLVSIKGGNSDE